MCLQFSMFLETQNNRILRVGKDLQDQVQPLTDDRLVNQTSALPRPVVH